MEDRSLEAELLVESGERLGLLGTAVELLGSGGDGVQTLTRLRDHLRQELLVAAVQREVALYGEPVHTVEELLALVEEDPRYQDPLSPEDTELVLGFVKGTLLKAKDSGVEVEDEGLQLLRSKIQEMEAAIPRPTPRAPVEPSVPFPLQEFDCPASLTKLFLESDEAARGIVTTLLELSRPDCDLWLRDRLVQLLGLVLTVLPDPRSKEERTGPTLVLRSNVEEPGLLTLALVGFLRPAGPPPPLQMDGVFSRKRYYGRSAHDVFGPLAAYLSALKLHRGRAAQYPFNLKVVLFPEPSGDEGGMDGQLAAVDELLASADYVLLMNCVDQLAERPAAVTSAPGHVVYLFAVYLPAGHRLLMNDGINRLKLILLEMMDLIRKYKFFNKHKKNMKTTYKGEEVPQEDCRVELGAVEEDSGRLELEDREVRVVGWRASVVIRYSCEREDVMPALTEYDLGSLRSSLSSTDPALSECYFQVELRERCRPYRAGEEYYSHLAPILRRAQLRATEDHAWGEADARSALPLARLIQIHMGLEPIVLTFGGIVEHGHHAISFLQLREAVRLVCAVLTGLRSSGRQRTQRCPAVVDVARLLRLPVAAHLERPYCLSQPKVRDLFQEFLSQLRGRQPTPPPPPPRTPAVRPVPGLLARYYSRKQEVWLSLEYSHLEKIAQQRLYLETARDLMRRKGVLEDGQLAGLMVAFLLLLFYRKRRSDVLCRFCEVHESVSEEGDPLVTPLAVSAEDDTGLVCANTVPKWVFLDDEEFARLVSSKGGIRGKDFIQMVKEIVFNIAFDGDHGSPVDKLFKLILDENISMGNDKLLKYFTGASSKLFSNTDVKDLNILKYPTLMLNMPKHTIDFDRCFGLFSKMFVNAEEFNRYILLDTIRTFLLRKVMNRFSNRNKLNSSLLRTSSEFKIRIKTSDNDVVGTVEEEVSSEETSEGGMVKEISHLQMIPYKRDRKWFVAYVYCIEKAKSGIEIYKYLWKLYKEKVRKMVVTPKAPFPVQEGEDSSPCYLVAYVKYSIAVLRHCFPLYWSLEDLYRLYFVIPDFLLWSAHLILKEALALPPLPPALKPEQLAALKKMDKRKDGWRESTSVPHSQRSTHHSPDSPEDGGRGRTIGSLRLTHKLRLEVRELVSLYKSHRSLMSRRAAVLAQLEETKSRWGSGEANNLPEFEEMLLLNIGYWDDKESPLQERYSHCEEVYEKMSSLLNSVGQPKPELPPPPTHLKNYRLRKRKDQLVAYFARRRLRYRTILGFLERQESALCRWPRDFYRRLVQAYTAVCNTMMAIVKLQRNRGDAVPKRWELLLLKKFPFVPDTLLITVVAGARCSADGMPRENLHIIPTAVALLAPTTFTITYVLSVYEHDVAALFPYVSSTGTQEPESYIFSMLLNITAFLLGACVYTRHLFVRNFARFRQPKGFFLNRVATYVGMLSCFGLDMVANFQVSKFPPLHYVGAGLCFFGGTIYFYMQTMLSRYMVQDLEQRRLFALRLLLTALSFGFLLIAVVTGLLAKRRFHGVEQRLWKPGEGGYVLHVCSAVAEWLTIFVQGSLVLTFLPAFKCIAIKQPRVMIEGLCSSSLVELDTVSSSIVFG